jgi:hypothetical protein
MMLIERLSHMDKVQSLIGIQGGIVGDLLVKKGDHRVMCGIDGNR